MIIYISNDVQDFMSILGLKVTRDKDSSRNKNIKYLSHLISVNAFHKQLSHFTFAGVVPDGSFIDIFIHYYLLLFVLLLFILEMVNYLPAIDTFL